MRLSRRAWRSLAVMAMVLAGAAFVRPQATAAMRYKCPPCGSSCDNRMFDTRGACPVCGMTLVTEAEAAAARQPARKKVAILVFAGCEILDFSGPYEMFGAAGCEVFTVAADKTNVTTSMGLTVAPRYCFADAPTPEVLVIPGGGVEQVSQNQPTLTYIKSVTTQAKYTMSVCNGVFILANTGLLDGLRATTTNGYLGRLAAQHPRIHVIRDRRYADNGKLITTAGLSAGMDGALHIIARLFGTGFAQAVALGEEYPWQPEGGFVRAALADNEIPELDMRGAGEWQTDRLEGDTQRWDAAFHGKPKGSPAEFRSHLEQALLKAKWTKVGGAGGVSTWKFTARDGKPWKGSVKLGQSNPAGELTAEIQVAREGRAP
jgi:putative intracellular protease/amidase/DNA-directed RNA polymerase subunit RPC12/RpoP